MIVFFFFFFNFMDINVFDLDLYFVNNLHQLPSSPGKNLHANLLLPSMLEHQVYEI